LSLLLSLIACLAGVSCAWAGASAAIDASNTPGVTPGQSSLTVGSQAVGSSSATQTLTFTIGAGTTVGGIAVVTQGAPNLDFTSAAGGTCTATTYPSATNCTVKVTFKPRAPGPRYGGVVFTDGSGSLLANVYLQGIGIGPVVTFANSTSGVYLPSKQTFLAQFALGIAVDASGNLFITDGGAVKEIVAVDGSIPASPTIKTLATGFGTLYGVAVDGSGNLFVADFSADALKEIVAAGGYKTVKTLFSGFNDGPYSNPGGVYGVAVDGSGNVFVSSWEPPAVRELVAADGYATVKKLVPGSFFVPYTMAVDGNGNVFVGDGYWVREILAKGGYTTVNTVASVPPRSDQGSLNAVALDASGNLFVTDEDNGAVKEYLAADGYTTLRTLSTGYTYPEGIAVDGSGNVFTFSFYPDVLVKLDYADPPSLSFASTPVGSHSSPQTVTVSNNGNADLIFPVPAAGDNPSISSGFTLDAATTCPNLSTSSTAAKLAGGTSCVYAVDSIPSAPDDYAGSLTLTDNSLNAAAPAYATQNISLTGTGLIAPFGWIDQTVDSVTGDTSVSQSHSVKVQGWVADAIDGAPLGNVTVFLDGVSIGKPTLGLQRADVAAVYGNAYLNSGFQLLYPAASLSLGTHQVTVVAVDSGGTSTTLGPHSVVVTPLVGNPPLGSIDLAVDSLTNSTTVGQSDSLKVRGWVADPQDGAPLTNVTVFLDGTSIGKPTLGIVRHDVAAAYKNNAYLNAGFQFLYPAASLSLGTHQVTVVAIDSVGRSTTLGPLAFTVAAVAGPGPPFGSIDWAVDSLSNSATVGQSDSLKVLGWFADRQDGAPLTNVTVYIDGISIGKPTLGIARPDVAAAYGNTYLNSGFQLLYPAASLSLGAHQVQAIAIDSAGRSTTLVSRFFMVAAGAGTPFGNLDLAVDSVTSGATVSQSHFVKVLGWVADPIDGAPMSNVTVYIDGTSIGKPTLGIARHDVAAAIKINAYLHSGFQLLYPASSLSLGAHQVTVVATDSGGVSTTFGPVTITVVP
jgi:hypothetical protein